MLKRLLIGLIKGVVLGGVLGLVLVKGLGIATMGVWLAYLLAVVAGVLSGLVAGKPIWAEGARIEAGLKALVGALLGAGLMYAARRWLGVHLDLGQFGHGSIAELPIVSLPLIASLLSMLYELDNTGDDDDTAKKPAKTKKQRVAAGGGDEHAELEDELEAEPSKKARRRG